MPDTDDMEQRLKDVEHDVETARRQTGVDKPNETPVYVDPGTGLEKGGDPEADPAGDAPAAGDSPT